MPVQVSYPGVYVEEIPSGVRTITGVATSITAFIGRALRGPTNKAVTINSFADFERIFGGLWTGSTLGYAVRDFYLNGGSQAIVVRLYNATSGTNAKSTLSVGGLKLEAAYEGAWGTYLRASVDTDVSQDVADRMGVLKSDLFNLTVKDTAPGGITEQIRNLTVKPSARQIDKVLALESNLVRLKGAPPSSPPTATSDEVSQAEAALATAQAALQAAQALPASDPNKATAIATATADVSSKQAALTTATGPVKASDGDGLTLAQFEPANGQANKQGLFALEQADLFNLL